MTERRMVSSGLPIGRTIAAIFFLGLACLVFWGRCVRCIECRRRQRFRCPVALGVDFSAPSAYAAAFAHSSTYVRRAYLGLDIPATALSDSTPEALLTRLQGTYAVLDADGEQVLSGSFAQDVDTLRLPRFELIRLASWDYFPLGDCEINVTVAQGAPALKGIPQRLILVVDDTLSLTFISIRSIIYVGCVCLLLAMIVVILCTRIVVSVWAEKHRSKSQALPELDHVEQEGR